MLSQLNITKVMALGVNVCYSTYDPVATIIHAVHLIVVLVTLHLSVDVCKRLFIAKLNFF